MVCSPGSTWKTLQTVEIAVVLRSGPSLEDHTGNARIDIRQDDGRQTLGVVRILSWSAERHSQRHTYCFTRLIYWSCSISIYFCLVSSKISWMTCFCSSGSTVYWMATSVRFFGLRGSSSMIGGGGWTIGAWKGTTWGSTGLSGVETVALY